MFNAENTHIKCHLTEKSVGKLSAFSDRKLSKCVHLTRMRYNRIRIVTLRFAKKYYHKLFQNNALRYKKVPFAYALSSKYLAYRGPKSKGCNCPSQIFLQCIDVITYTLYYCLITTTWRPRISTNNITIIRCTMISWRNLKLLSIPWRNNYCTSRSSLTFCRHFQNRTVARVTIRAQMCLSNRSFSIAKVFQVYLYRFTQAWKSFSNGFTANQPKVSTSFCRVIYVFFLRKL